MKNIFFMRPLLCTLLLLFFSLAGCSTTGAGDKIGKSVPYDCLDVRTMPQDLQSYAQRSGGGTPLLSADELAQESEKARRWFFYPWRVTAPAANKANAFWAAYNMKPDKAFTTKYAAFSAGAWHQLVANCNQASYPALLAHGITVGNTNLRAMPTHEPFYRNPSLAGEGHPFDYFQHTALWVGSPVVITHVSSDGKWYLAETRMAHGWLPVEDVALVDDSFMQKWQSLPLAAVIDDNVSLHQDSWYSAPHQRKKGGVKAHIGTLLPFQSAHTGTVLYPIRNAQGRVDIGSAAVLAHQVQPFPLTPSASAIAMVGNRMMGQPYGWGGLEELRDCSSLTRDLLLPFGIWLPRNSAQQAAWGSPLILTGMSTAQKESVILASARPFFSLIWLKGHVGLYVGEYRGKAAMYHNVWGIRTGEMGKPSEGRAVIGKAVVTSLQPGLELPNIARAGSLLERIERVSILPEAEDKVPVMKTKPKKSKKIVKKKSTKRLSPKKRSR